MAFLPEDARKQSVYAFGFMRQAAPRQLRGMAMLGTLGV
jgi:hypothetical protein